MVLGPLCCLSLKAQREREENFSMGGVVRPKLLWFVFFFCSRFLGSILVFYSRDRAPVLYILHFGLGQKMQRKADAWPT